MPAAIEPETIEKIKALLANGSSVRKVAKTLGISQASVIKYRDEDPDEFEQLRADKKQEFIENAWGYVNDILASAITKLPEANFKDAMTGLGILIDKYQLVAGEPTSRSENANRNVHSLDEISTEQAKALVKMYMEGGGG